MKVLADRAGIDLPEQDNVKKGTREQEDLKSKILEMEQTGGQLLLLSAATAGRKAGDLIT